VIGSGTSHRLDAGRRGIEPRGGSHEYGPGLRPPAVPEPPVPPKRHLGLWIALVVVLSLAFGVVWLLPRLVSGPLTGPEDTFTGAPPGGRLAAPDSASQVAGERSRAERELQGFLRLAARLELANVAAWGEPNWGRAAGEAAQGDRWLAQRRFAAAAEAYARGHQILQELEQGGAARLADALLAGDQALAETKIAQARSAFELALAIAPANGKAAKGMQRAQVREDVLELMRRARQAEADGDLEIALAAYQEAFGLDGAYSEADASRERVSQALAESAFQEAMSSALAALQAGDLDRAGEQLQQAGQLRPGHEVLMDAQRRLEQARKQEQLSRLRLVAQQGREAEDWPAVIATYQQALALEPRAGFARRGLDLARSRRELHAQLDRYLRHPERLYSPAPLESAQRLALAYETGLEDEPRLASKLTELQLRIDQARTPVPVVVHSDGQTEVTVYHVGRLGRFLDLRLELRPGTYTAVGSRTGYRDVRREFTLRPGAADTSLVVRCEEQI